MGKRVDACNGWVQLLCVGMKDGESRCGNFHKGHTFCRVFRINQYIEVMQ